MNYKTYNNLTNLHWETMLHIIFFILEAPANHGHDVP